MAGADDTVRDIEGVRVEVVGDEMLSEAMKVVLISDTADRVECA
jgi:hypothetical protein